MITLKQAAYLHNLSLENRAEQPGDRNFRRENPKVQFLESLYQRDFDEFVKKAKIAIQKNYFNSFEKAKIIKLLKEKNEI